MSAGFKHRSPSLNSKNLINWATSPVPFIILNTELNLDTKNVTIKGSWRGRGAQQLAWGSTNLAFIRFPCSWICQCCGVSFPLAESSSCDEQSHKGPYKFLLWLDGAAAGAALFCMEVFRHIIITFCRFANNDITQSPYCGYDLLQITKCYYMEISFHTTAARGLLSRVALITRMGTGPFQDLGQCQDGLSHLTCWKDLYKKQSGERCAGAERSALKILRVQGWRCSSLWRRRHHGLLLPLHLRAAFWPPPEQLNAPFLIWGKTKNLSTSGSSINSLSHFSSLGILSLFNKKETKCVDILSLHITNIWAHCA